MMQASVREELKREIEELLSRFGERVGIAPEVLENLSTEALQEIAASLREHAKRINEEHKDWLFGLASEE